MAEAWRGTKIDYIPMQKGNKQKEVIDSVETVEKDNDKVPVEREFRFTLKKEYHDTKFSNVKINIKQGYLFKDSKKLVRVRTCIDETNIDNGCEGYITIKITIDNESCAEYEYPIPFSHAQQLMSTCEDCIEKNRYLVSDSGFVWEIDVFEGKLSGLVLAEIELKENQQLPNILPIFVAKDITHIKELKNVNLVGKDYKQIMHLLN